MATKDIGFVEPEVNGADLPHGAVWAAQIEDPAASIAKQDFVDFTPTVNGNFRGEFFGYKVLVFEKDGLWSYNIEHPNGTKDWGRNPKRTADAAQRAVFNWAQSLHAEAAAEGKRPKPGGALQVKPAKSQKQLHDAFSSKLNTTRLRKLKIGSDLEIAKKVVEDLRHEFGDCVFADGALWYWADTHWVALPEHIVERTTHPYDGALVCFKDPATGEEKVKFEIRLTKSKIASIVHSAAGLMAHPDFFKDPEAGINCMTGFIQFEGNGEPKLVPHDRKHKQRHVLPGHWDPNAETDGVPPTGSLLALYLSGIFKGDAEERLKLSVLQEVIGSAAAGVATRLMRPKAVMLLGALAENGKSQFLDLCRGVLPEEACCAVTPSKVTNEYHVARLVGKLLNASDEASTAEAIGGETFKAVVTGEPVSGRPIYGHPVEFRSQAQNVFALNALPNFRGGMDRGVQRRLLVLPFNRRIPVDERVEGIGTRIAVEEPDLLLAWAVRGASRLIFQRDFTEPAECKQALADWLLRADAVEGWFEDCVTVVPIDPSTNTPQMRTRDAYAAFKLWAQMEGYKEAFIPIVTTFSQRLGARPGVVVTRNKSGSVTRGIEVRQELLDEMERRDALANAKMDEEIERGMANMYKYMPRVGGQG